MSLGSYLDALLFIVIGFKAFTTIILILLVSWERAFAR